MGRGVVQPGNVKNGGGGLTHSRFDGPSRLPRSLHSFSVLGLAAEAPSVAQVSSGVPRPARPQRVMNSNRVTISDVKISDSLSCWRVPTKRWSERVDRSSVGHESRCKEVRPRAKGEVSEGVLPRRQRQFMAAADFPCPRRHEPHGTSRRLESRESLPPAFAPGQGQ